MAGSVAVPAGISLAGHQRCDFVPAIPPPDNPQDPPFTWRSGGHEKVGAETP